jgi:ribosome recycling factor
MQSIVKQLNKIAEDNRQRIRRIRRAAQDIVKKAKDGNVKGISKDDAFRVGNQIDDVTEECIKAINDIVDRKSSSVMSF